MPAILQTVTGIACARDKMSWKTRAVLSLFALLNVLLLLILAAKVPFSTGIYFWSSLVWFAFYVYGKRYAARHSDTTDDPPFGASPPWFDRF